MDGYKDPGKEILYSPLVGMMSGEFVCGSGRERGDCMDREESIKRGYLNSDEKHTHPLTPFFHCGPRNKSKSGLEAHREIMS